MCLKILAATAALMLFCSCGALSLSGMESLMVAPKLNKQQADVAQAFESAVSMQSIIYKPPQSGEYRSPFVFYDIDGDSLDEAIVFYAYSDDETGSVRATVLKQSSNGKWRLFYDAASPTQGTEIEFVRFEHILSAQSSCVITGWKAAAVNKPSNLTVYSIKDGAFYTEASSDYLNYNVEDFDGDGLAELAIITQGGVRDSFVLNLWSGLGASLEISDSAKLSSEVASPLAMTSGTLWDGRSGIYVDEILSGTATTLATEIFRADRGGLTLLAGGEPVSRDEPDSTARSNYEWTFRDDVITCMKTGGDGVVEVPFPETLPGPREVADVEPPKFIRFMRLSSGGFEEARSGVVNQSAGYLVYFPERWLDNVTVEIERETNEWHFRKWNEDVGVSAEELLRVRTVTKSGVPDVFGDKYVELGKNGTTMYSAYIPELQSGGLEITEQEAREMFRLLS